jgi:integrase
MAGTLRKVGDNKWLVRVFLGRNENGRTQHFNKTINGTKKDAQRFLTRKLTDVDTGIPLTRNTVESLNSHLDEWLDISASKNVSARTLNNYKSLIRNHISESLGGMRLMNVKTIDIDRLYSTMTANGYSPKTVRHIHNILSSAFERGIDWEKLTVNPCKRVRLPRQRRAEMKFLTAEQCRRFLKVAKKDDLHALFVLAITTGMRPEEYLALKWSDIDFARSEVRVSRVLIGQKGGGFIFERPKTAKSERVIQLGEEVIAAIKQHRMKQLKLRHRLADSYQDDDLVFATRIGTPIAHRNLARRHFKPLLKAAGLPDIRLYDLRHTATTMMHQAGVNLKVISDQLGHASSVLTLDTYSHVTPAMHNDGVKRMNVLLFGT